MLYLLRIILNGLHVSLRQIWLRNSLWILHWWLTFRELLWNLHISHLILLHTLITKIGAHCRCHRLLRELHIMRALRWIKLLIHIVKFRHLVAYISMFKIHLHWYYIFEFNWIHFSLLNITCIRSLGTLIIFVLTLHT